MPDHDPRPPVVCAWFQRRRDLQVLSRWLDPSPAGAPESRLATHGLCPECRRKFFPSAREGIPDTEGCGLRNLRP